MKKRIGIFSGTFDPIHEGHLAFIEVAREAATLDEVVVIIERQPRGKQPIASLEDRVVMTKKALEHLSDVVVRPSKLANTSLDDLSELVDGSDLYILIGSDIVGQISQWQNHEKWLPQVSVVVGLRAGHDEAKISELMVSLDFREKYIVSSPELEAASSKTRRDSGSLLPSIAEYAHTHQLYI